MADALRERIRHEGITVAAAAPIEHIPVFIRAEKVELVKLFRGLYEL